MSDSPLLRYHMLRYAVERFHGPPSRLPPEQLALTRQQATQSLALESRVLASPEARHCPVEPKRLARALAAIRARYPDATEYHGDMADNGLDEALLRKALARELQFDAVMKRVAADLPPVSEAQAQDFYRQNPGRFSQAEAREARHILITLNPDFPDNAQDRALVRIQALAGQLAERGAGAFGELARNHSECPTALQDGKLGWVQRGQLYPQLEQVLFTMDGQQISGVVDSPMGLHLLSCEAIRPARTLGFQQVQAAIIEYLDNQRRKARLRQWLAGLETPTQP